MATTTRHIDALDKLIIAASNYRTALVTKAKWEQHAERHFLQAVHASHDACQQPGLEDFIDDLTRELTGHDYTARQLAAMSIYRLAIVEGQAA